MELRSKENDELLNNFSDRKLFKVVRFALQSPIRRLEQMKECVDQNGDDCLRKKFKLRFLNKRFNFENLKKSDQDEKISGLNYENSDEIVPVSRETYSKFIMPITENKVENERLELNSFEKIENENTFNNNQENSYMQTDQQLDDYKINESVENLLQQSIKQSIENEKTENSSENKQSFAQQPESYRSLFQHADSYDPYTNKDVLNNKSLDIETVNQLTEKILNMLEKIDEKNMILEDQKKNKFIQKKKPEKNMVHSITAKGGAGGFGGTSAKPGAGGTGGAVSLTLDFE